MDGSEVASIGIISLDSTSTPEMSSSKGKSAEVDGRLASPRIVSPQAVMSPMPGFACLLYSGLVSMAAQAIKDKIVVDLRALSCRIAGVCVDSPVTAPCSSGFSSQIESCLR